MATLGNYHHDFPRLAKQSGYFFQLYRGRVNWTAIESLNVDDIIENRNFQLLEQNLVNVVNCNLEREYDLKILDQNFVKLFKIAQLGVDYLSYCELYLDRCVILLQEQLLTFQKEYETLKIENNKKSEELKKSKKKTGTQNYQCDKCEKVFISDVYLKFHDKRRHNNPTTPKSLDHSLKKCIDTYQQTEDKRKLSVSVQTLPVDKEVTESRESEEIIKIKQEHNIKIGKLETEIEDLKIRLRKAEETLTEKTEPPPPQPPQSQPHHFPGPIYYPSMLQFFPSYLPQPHGNFYDPYLGHQISVPQSNPPVKHESANVETPKFEIPPDRVHLAEAPERDIEEKTDSCKIDSKQKETDADKENINPKPNVISKPLPLPRKTKNTNDKKRVESFTVKQNAFEDFVSFNNQSITSSSTPLKEQKPEIAAESKESLVSDGNERETISNVSGETNRVDNKSKAFIKGIVTKNSPRIQKLSKNFKKSLTNFYESVSLAGKQSLKAKDLKSYKTRAVVVNELNSRLRELGVDPEWSGIPEKTMKQKLNSLRHRRKLLSKENPFYPVVRRSIEDKIFRKLKQKFSAKKTLRSQELNEQESSQGSSKREQSFKEEKPETLEVKISDTDSDLESKVSDFEEVFTEEQKVPPQKMLLIKDLNTDNESEGKEKPFDLSVFQRGSSRTENGPRGPVGDEMTTDSDFDDDFLANFDVRDFGDVHAGGRSKDGSGQDERQRVLFVNSGSKKMENESSLKSIQRNQEKFSMNCKKKVLFMNHVDQEDKGNMRSMNNDDVWSLKTDWEKDLS